MNKEEFIRECEKLNVVLTEKNVSDLYTYSKLLIEWNEKFNLTSIKEEKSIFLKHFFDSLCLVKAIDLNRNISICDVGSGAGLPGLVLKIIFDKLNITLIESSNKKCEFLKHVVKELNLNNVEIINDRAEQLAKKIREKYDVVTCRAVSALYIISELCIPMVKVNGYFLPLKSEVQEEIHTGNKIIENTGAKIEKVIEYKLPVEDSKRTIIVIKKYKATNLKYPREYNKIIKTS